MEFYFKDLEAEDGASDLPLDFPANGVAEEQSDTAEDRAFAELTERVSAARLVY